MTRILLLQESLCTSCLAGVPAELGSPAGVLGLLADHQGIPGFVDERLMEQTVDDPRMHPVALGEAGLEVSGHVLDVALAGRVERRAEAAGPVLAFAEKLDHLVGMGAGLAAVALLVVLVERVGAPETAVAARLGARVLPPSLVELVLVALPVVLALEASLA